MRFICIGFLLLISSVVSAKEIYEVEFMKGEYNRIVLPEPYVNVIFSKNSPIKTPMELNEKRQLLIKPVNTAAKSFNAIFTFETGDVFTLVITPKRLEKPVVWRYKDAPDEAAFKGHTISSKQKWLKRLFVSTHSIHYSLSEDEAPRGFSPVKNPKPLILKTVEKIELKLNPVARYRGMGHILSTYTLSTNSEAPIRIDNPDFYTEGTIAISLEMDWVSSNSSPYLFILTKEK